MSLMTKINKLILIPFCRILKAKYQLDLEVYCMYLPTIIIGDTDTLNVGQRHRQQANINPALASSSSYCTAPAQAGPFQ